MKQLDSKTFLTLPNEVFGKVTNGLEIVRKIEAYGTEFGKPKATITVADSGSL